MVSVVLAAGSIETHLSEITALGSSLRCCGRRELLENGTPAVSGICVEVAIRLFELQHYSSGWSGYGRPFVSANGDDGIVKLVGAHCSGAAAHTSAVSIHRDRKFRSVLF
jgi:hypothetical protein